MNINVIMSIIILTVKMLSISTKFFHKINSRFISLHEKLIETQIHKKKLTKSQRPPRPAPSPPKAEAGGSSQVSPADFALATGQRLQSSTDRRERTRVPCRLHMQKSPINHRSIPPSIQSPIFQFAVEFRGKLLVIRARQFPVNFGIRRHAFPLARGTREECKCESRGMVTQFAY